MDGLGQDLKFAIRSLTHRPGSTAAAMLASGVMSETLYGVSPRHPVTSLSARVRPASALRYG